MGFKEEYTTKEKKLINPAEESNKTELSNDAFALGDMIENLIGKIDQIRRNL